VKIGRQARDQLTQLIAAAAPLRGDFFRSVAFKYFHPDDVISGEGTRLSGGRFVPAGVKAVYASVDEETAMREVTARKKALSGRKQLDLGEYPRMTYVLSVTIRRNLQLAGRLPPELGGVVAQCLRSSSYSDSQDLAAIWIAQGIESVVFPSSTGIGKNIVIYLANAGRRSVAVRNRDHVLAALRKAPRARK
jgi:RES domain-containing protein